MPRGLFGRNRAMAVYARSALPASLSSREKETMMLLSSGHGPKQIAAHLGVCTHTARVHSSRLMAKMGARSIPDLVRMVDTLGTCEAADSASSTQTPIANRPLPSAQGKAGADIAPAGTWANGSYAFER